MMDFCFKCILYLDKSNNVLNARYCQLKMEFLTVSGTADLQA